MYLGMALRVLLADESSTIKKAIQMVLSDYGVDVKIVPTGLDVLSIAQSYNPDIVFADVLLTKKSGYDVCQELKSHTETQRIPVVLMWSNFMQLDQELYKLAKADASLEKPFETQTLRSLVESLVPKLQTFPLKGFLNHAELPDFEESDTFVRQKTMAATLAPVTGTAVGDSDKTKVDEDKTKIDEDKTAADAVSATNAQPTEVSDEGFSEPVHTTAGSPNEEWSAAKTGQFVIETENYGDFEEVKVINPPTPEAPDLQKKINEQIQAYLKDSPVVSHKAQASLQQQQQRGYSSFDEQLMREEIRQMTERICWQVIPEITEKIVREELNKLLQGIENSI